MAGHGAQHSGHMSIGASWSQASEIDSGQLRTKRGLFEAKEGQGLRGELMGALWCSETTLSMVPQFWPQPPLWSGRTSFAYQWERQLPKKKDGCGWHMETTCIHLNEAEIKGDRDSAIRCPQRDPSKREYSGNHGAEADGDAGERTDAS